ncbi:hypothetical protein [Corynebacterium urealyticum]|uniref:hypothetical protein n=1 Tax=Corynebacterium urealyticum TaxID=43771 RepID=UPI0011E8762E|nr:hypothetical protein [Corynebacterium urealyticum]TYR15600.1 hypothetical protein FYJ89_03470 [Corynebacterium urealyticum]TYR17936.1 hypothetical protein FYJ88_03670 [Corynebacterium urealyticum]
MEHNEWLRRVADGDPINAIARKAGIVPRTFARQVDRNRIDAESIIAVAVAYGSHPVRALIDTGYLEAHWAAGIDPVAALRAVTEEQLAHEVLRRMKLGVDSNALTTPIDEIPHLHAVADSSPDEDELRHPERDPFDTP